MPFHKKSVALTFELVKGVKAKEAPDI